MVDGERERRKQEKGKVVGNVRERKEQWEGGNEKPPASFSGVPTCTLCNPLPYPERGSWVNTSGIVDDRWKSSKTYGLGFTKTQSERRQFHLQPQMKSVPQAPNPRSSKHNSVLAASSPPHPKQQAGLRACCFIFSPPPTLEAASVDLRLLLPGRTEIEGVATVGHSHGEAPPHLPWLPGK